MSGGISVDSPRYVALWVPNWELSSLVVEVPPGAPAAVVDRFRVQVVTPAAQDCGVKVGMSQVMAQYCCPELLIFPPDPGREPLQCFVQPQTLPVVISLSATDLRDSARSLINSSKGISPFLALSGMTAESKISAAWSAGISLK